MYELTQDPNELQNVAGDPRYADVPAGLRRRLRAWQGRARDPWVIEYTHE